MKANLLLEDLIEKVLQEIRKFGLSTEGYRQYIRAYDKIEEFASKQGIYSYCEMLLTSYVYSQNKRFTD